MIGNSLLRCTVRLYDTTIIVLDEALENGHKYKLEKIENIFILGPTIDDAGSCKGNGLESLHSFIKYLLVLFLWAKTGPILARPFKDITQQQRRRNRAVDVHN